MIRRRSTAMLLTVALIAQSMIAGLGHDHHEYDGHHGHTHVAHMHAGHGMHEHRNASVGHSHDHHSHDHHSHVGHSQSHTHNGITGQADGKDAPRDHSPLPSHQDDCSVCRHLSLAAALTLELETVAVGNAVATATNADSLLTSATTAGLYQPRAPPEFS